MRTNKNTSGYAIGKADKPKWKEPKALIAAILLVALAAGAWVVLAGDDEQPATASDSLTAGGHLDHGRVVAVDRTGVARHSPGWATEVGGSMATIVEDAFDNGVDELKLISVGSDFNDTAVVATADLALDCPNRGRCADDREALTADLIEAATAIAEIPVDEAGTDLISAFVTADDLCERYEACDVFVLSDVIDSRIAEPGTPEDLAAQYAADFPEDLSGTPVVIAGLGANDPPPRQLERSEAFISLLLEQAHAPYRITRSL
jgi:hypothetical protein